MYQLTKFERAKLKLLRTFIAENKYANATKDISLFDIEDDVRKFGENYFNAKILEAARELVDAASESEDEN